MTRSRLVPGEVAVAAVDVTTTVMGLLDSTVVNVALPSIARDFKVGTASIQGIVVGYLLSLAVWVPASTPQTG
jgi:MFS family permease